MKEILRPMAGGNDDDGEDGEDYEEEVLPNHFQRRGSSNFDRCLCFPIRVTASLCGAQGRIYHAQWISVLG